MMIFVKAVLIAYALIMLYAYALYWADGAKNICVGLYKFFTAKS